MGLTALALALGVGSSSAADPTLAVLTSGRGGKARALIDPGAALPVIDAANFRAVVGVGGAQVAAASAIGAEPAYTALAFDASGSFRAHLPASQALARDFLQGQASSPPWTVAVYTFGASLSDIGAATDLAAAESLIGSLPSAGNQQVTRLKSFVTDVVDQVAARQPVTAGGLRQVVVFTDGGEESKVGRMQDVIDDARARGVRVHVVRFPVTRGTLSATALDEIEALAVETGGTYVDGDAAGASATLRDTGAGASRLVWLDLAFCGVTASTPFVIDKLHVELLDAGRAVGQTRSRAFSQELSAASSAPCPADIVAAAGASQPAGTSPTPVTAAPTSPGGGTGFPWWIAGAGLGLLAVLAGLGAMVVLGRLLASRRGTAEGAPPPLVDPPGLEDADRKREHSFIDAPARPDEHDQFVELPETRLWVEPGSALVAAGIGHYLRVTRRDTLVGGDAERVGESPPGGYLHVDVRQVSGRHAKIELFPRAMFVTDLGSSNGTFVNGVRLAPEVRTELRPGDRVGFSRQVSFRVGQGRTSPFDTTAAPADAPAWAGSAPHPSAVAGLASPPVEAASPSAAPPRTKNVTVITAVSSPMSSSTGPTLAPLPPDAASPPSEPGAAPGQAPPRRKKTRTVYAPMKPPGEEGR